MRIKGISIGEGHVRIAVPIVAKDTKELEEKLKKAIEKNADIIEWRADCLKDWSSTSLQDCENLIQNYGKNTPMIFTYRREAGNGINKETYYKICEWATELSEIDCVDIEYNTEEEKRKYFIEHGRRKEKVIILSHHIWNDMPSKESLIQILDELKNAQADVIKLAAISKNNAETEMFMRVCKRWKKENHCPMIAIAMGEKGRASRVCAKDVGSEITFGNIGEMSAPGQIFIDRLQEQMKIAERERNIFLVGFMGSGKTSTAKKLGEELFWTVCDLDEEVEKKEQMRVAEIFKKKGEEYFRQKEGEILKEMGSDFPMIVSCGGGIVLNRENIEWMKKHGRIYYLAAQPDIIWNRIGNQENRPLLKEKDKVHVKKLMEERRILYKEACDKKIDTDGKSPSQVAKEIYVDLIR